MADLAGEWPATPIVFGTARMWDHPSGDRIINPIGCSSFGAHAAQAPSHVPHVCIGVFTTWKAAAAALDGRRARGSTL